MSSDPAQQRQYLEAGHVKKKDWAQHRAVHNLFTCRTCLDTWALAAMFGLPCFLGGLKRSIVNISEKNNATVCSLRTVSQILIAVLNERQHTYVGRKEEQNHKEEVGFRRGS